MAQTAYWIIETAGNWVSDPAITGAQIAAGNLANNTAAFKNGSETGFATTGTVTITEGTAEALSQGAYNIAWTVYDDTLAEYADVVVGTAIVGAAGAVTLAGVQATVAQAEAVTGTFGELSFTGVQATVSQAVTVTGTPGEIALAGAAGIVSQSQDVTGTPGTLTFAGAPGVVSRAQNLTGNAGMLTFAGGSGVVTYGNEINIAGTAGSVTLAGVAGTVAQAEAVTGNAGTLTLAGTPGVVGQAATITGGAGTLAFAGAPGTVAQPINLTGTPGALTLSGVQGSVTGSVVTNIAGNAGELTFTGIQGVVTQDGGISGRVIRRRRSRTPYWDEDEALSVLLMKLGKHPTERDTKSLRAAAKAGLADVIAREPVVAHYDATGALLLETIGAQIRLQGALKAHAETLMDDEDVFELLQLIA